MKPFPVPKDQRTEPYWKELNKVIDPELGVGVVDLGLIYNVEIDGENATVTMTLTSPGCPVGPQIMHQVELAMLGIDGITSPRVEITWDPPWNQDLIDQDIRDLMWGF